MTGLYSLRRLEELFLDDLSEDQNGRSVLMQIEHTRAILQHRGCVSEDPEKSSLVNDLLETALFDLLESLHESGWLNAVEERRK